MYHVYDDKIFLLLRLHAIGLQMKTKQNKKYYWQSVYDIFWVIKYFLLDSS